MSRSAARETSAADADVCMLIEGTYPFADGGVSEWAHELITNLPDIRFRILHVGLGDRSR